MGFLPPVTISEEDLKAVRHLYEADLPYPELLEIEVVSWKHHTSGLEDSSITAVLDRCLPSIFPNINVLLKIAATLPVTTCECERSFSCLRRLNSYLRKTQTSQRLDSLALISIHCGAEVEQERVIDLFASLHPRRMELSSLIFEKV